MPNDIETDVRNLKNAVFGNPENPRETPGVIAELAQMNVSMKEIRDAMRKINTTIVLGFLTALMAIVFRGLNSP